MATGLQIFGMNVLTFLQVVSVLTVILWLPGSKPLARWSALTTIAGWWLLAQAGT